MQEQRPLKLTTAEACIDALGLDAIAAATGSKPKTVRNKKFTGFPAYWWPDLSRLGAERGFVIDHSVCNFDRKGAA